MHIKKKKKKKKKLITVLNRKILNVSNNNNNNRGYNCCVSNNCLFDREYFADNIIYKGFIDYSKEEKFILVLCKIYLRPDDIPTKRVSLMRSLSTLSRCQNIISHLKIRNVVLLKLNCQMFQILFW